MVTPQEQNLTLTVPTERWETVEPVGRAIFMAQRRGDFEYFRPTLTVNVTAKSPGMTLLDAADALVQDLREIDPEAESRRDTSGLDEGRVLQSARFAVRAEGLPPVRLAQWHVIVDMPTEEDAPSLVMAVVLAAEEATIEEYEPDFQAFITSATVGESPES